MSFRGVDQNLAGLIRSMTDRLTRLEKQVGQIRQNTIRMGQWVIEADGDKRLKMTNLETGEVTYVGDQYIPFVASKEWSFAGTVAPSSDVIAPAWCTPHEITLTHVIVQLQTPSAVDYTVRTYVNDVNVLNTTLPAGLKKKLVTLELDVPGEDNVYPYLEAASGGTGTELSVTYWYTGIYTGEM